MIRLLYFAGVREKIGRGAEEVALPDGVGHVAGLVDHLVARGEPWTALAECRNLRVAVNQTLVGNDAPVRDRDEIAFFPPVTGG